LLSINLRYPFSGVLDQLTSNLKFCHLPINSSEFKSSVSSLRKVPSTGNDKYKPSSYSTKEAATSGQLCSPRILV